MKLYHGSNVLITVVDFTKCKPFKDFGKGFYFTEIEEQAIQMARRTTLIYGGDATISNFEFDLESAFLDANLRIKQFEDPNEEWALFVLGNRDKNRIQPYHEYDIIIGPVADVAIATLFRNFSDGVIDLPMLVNGLKYKKISSQYFFHTPNAIKYIKSI